MTIYTEAVQSETNNTRPNVRSNVNFVATTKIYISCTKCVKKYLWIICSENLKTSNLYGRLDVQGLREIAVRIHASFCHGKIVHLTINFHRPKLMLIRSEAIVLTKKNPQTNPEITLKTSSSLRYATPVKNNHTLFEI